MDKRLMLLQCLSLIIIAVTGLPIDETAKNTGDTVEITPTEDKLPKTGDVSDLDDLDKIIPDTLPDDLPEFVEPAKSPTETVDITPTDDQLPNFEPPKKPTETEDNTPTEEKLPILEPAKNPTGTVDITPTEDKLPHVEPAKNPTEPLEITPTEVKLPNTGTSEDNAPKTGQSLEDLDKILPNLIPDLSGLPKVPDLIPECKKENETCSGFPSCCGDFKCYWEKGLSFVKKGMCVPCVAEGLSCFRSGQCCGNNDDDDKDPAAIICDKGTNPFEDGTCAPKRTSGTCYKNKQCMGHDCDKKWYRLTGNCVAQGE